MSATDEKDKKGGGAAALLSQLQSQSRAARGYEKTLFRVVEVVRGPDGRLSRQGRIWHSDLSHVRRFGRALAANSVSQQVVIADAAGAVIETLPVVGPGAIGWNDWRATVPPVQAAPAPGAAPPPAVGRPQAEEPPASAASAAGWATDTLFDDLPDELAVAEKAAAPAAADAVAAPAGGEAAEPPPADIGALADAATPAHDFIPDPTITGDSGIVMP
jgi:hypothetical protein